MQREGTYSFLCCKWVLGMLREEKLAGGLRYAPLKEHVPAEEITLARGGTIQAWAKSQAQMSTAVVPSICTGEWASSAPLHLWPHYPGALPVALLMLHQPGTVFVLLLLVSSGFRSWVGSETSGDKLVASLCRNPLEAGVPAGCSSTGGCSVCSHAALWAAALFWGSWSSEPLKAVVLLNTQGNPRNLQFKEKHPWDVSGGLAASTPSRQKRLSVMRAYRETGGYWEGVFWHRCGWRGVWMCFFFGRSPARISSWG